MTVEPLQILEEMIESLVELLVEKGVITEEEFDTRLEERMEKSRTLK